MRNRLALVGIAAFLLLSFPVAALAQTCSAEEQLSMNTCVGDGVDTCHGTYMYCKRQLEEIGDFRGHALEDCCCDSGAPVEQASFRACRSAKYRKLVAAKDLFSQSFFAPAKRILKRLTFADCNFGCDF